MAERLDEIDPERFMLFGEWLCGKVEACTCATGPEGQHEPHCGLEPVATLDEIVNAEHRVAAAKAELERTEGDLAVAVHEAQDARGRLDKAQRVVVACRTSKYRGDADWLWLNFRAALAAPVQPEEPDHA